MGAATHRPDPPPAMQSGHLVHPVYRQGAGRPYTAQSDELACEIPVALEYNGLAHATVLATPQDLEDLAYGFSFTEGLIRTASDLYDVEVITRGKGIVLQLTIASACLNQLKARRRNLAGRTGCGLCGLESLDEVERTLSPLANRPRFVQAGAIGRAMDGLRSLQPLHLKTGATHAAGWADLQGDILAVREDVGRHNALDKLIGHLLRQEYDTSQGFAAISSRASFEMVQKAAAAGISGVAAVSAPTSYAVNMADSLNVLLVGFARQHGFTVYAHPEFLVPYPESAPKQENHLEKHRPPDQDG